jgi:aspartyl-tRNA(Asn)/glutamyl-tRNA(Gln) amidotransferase subunit C
MIPYAAPLFTAEFRFFPSMSLDRDDVKRAARLARIAISEAEADEVLQQLERIFGMIAEMQAVDVSDVEPMSHAQDLTLRLRDDKVTEVDQHELFQAIAPRVERGLYLVPKVIE